MTIKVEGQSIYYCKWQNFILYIVIVASANLCIIERCESHGKLSSYILMWKVSYIEFAGQIDFCKAYFDFYDAWKRKKGLPGATEPLRTL